MNTLLVFALSSAACWLFAGGRTPWRTPPRRPARHGPGAFARQRPPPQESLPRLVRQLASLLAAGRTGPILWSAMAQVLAAEQRRVQGAGAEARGRVGAGGADLARAAGAQRQQMAGTGRAGQSASGPDATLLLVLAVQRASAMGLPTASAIRNACGESAGHGGERRQGSGTLTPQQRRTWLDVAACFEVCEASGAPVAAVLDRLAAAIEADHDAAALRETALAGPRATVRLLTWLPFVGLGLGMVMGVDPLAALFGSPVGWTVLAAGVGFAVVGRTWSAKMISSAARPVQTLSGRRR